MTNAAAARDRIRSRHRRGEPTILVPIKMTPGLRKRFRIMATMEDLTYAQLIEYLLDEHDARLARQRRGQVHPLHQPTEADLAQEAARVLTESPSRVFG